MSAPVFRTVWTDEDVFGQESQANSTRAIEKARLYITANGIYDCRINGQAVTDTWLNPGNSAYNLRQTYQIYDIGELLAEDTSGTNTIEITLGHGWYDRAVGYDGIGAIWGDRLGLLAQAEIWYCHPIWRKQEPLLHQTRF